MIINGNKFDVETMGIGKAKSCTIAATPKAFEALSSMVYKHKARAILRELTANAIDAHRDAGTLDKQYQIHLPTFLEPYFSIRDFGTGMSKTKIDKLYRTFFGSDKTDEEHAIGYFGIGSKTPFALTQSFTLISIHEGRKTTYSVFKNKAGIPDIAPISSENSDEHSGIEVKFTVEEKYFREFERECDNVFTHFKIKPEFLGDLKPEIPTVAYESTGNGWGMRDSDNTKNGAYAIMGGIAYPMTDFPTENDNYKALLEFDIDIEFDLGAFEPSLSRESISYIDHSITNIEKRLEEILVELRDNIAKRFNDCTSLYQARLLADKIYKQEYKGFRRILKNDQISWNGQDINLFYKVDIKKINGLVVKRYWRSWKKMENSLVDEYHVDSNPVYYSEKGSGFVQRVRLALENVQRENPIFVVYERKKGAVAEFKKQLGMSDTEDLVNINTLPKPERNSYGNISGDYNPLNAKRILMLDIEFLLKHSGNPAAFYKECEIDEDDGEPYFYVNIDRYMINDNSPTYLRKYFNVFKVLGIVFNDDIIALKKSRWDTHKPNWIEFTDWARKQINEAIKNNNFQPIIDKVTLIKVVETYSYLLNDDIKKLVNFESIIPKVDALTEDEKACIETLNQNCISTLNQLLYNAEAEKIKTAAKSFLEKYPLMKYAFSNTYYSREDSPMKYMSWEVEEILNYMMLVDSGKDTIDNV